MARPHREKRGDELGRTSSRDSYFVVSADDFGRSPSVNRAVATAFDEGVLTSAGIVAGGAAFEEAAEMAARRPRLSVGIHVTLSDGVSVLAPGFAPGLVDGSGRFRTTPFRAGVAYWRLRRSIAGSIEAEVEAQFDKVEKAGIRPTHVDCHHHLHVHPLLFDIIVREAAARGVGWIRVPREPLGPVLRLHSGRPGTLATWLVFRLLTGRCLRVVGENGMHAVGSVYGLAGTGRMDEDYVLSLLPHVRGPVSEMYLHPDLGTEKGMAETKAATSGRVRERMAGLGLVLAGFGDLPDGSAVRPKETGGREIRTGFGPDQGRR